MGAFTRYIGNKTNLLSMIYSVIKKCKVSSVLDLFSGTGSVSNFLLERGYKVTSNDILYFCYCLAKGSQLQADKELLLYLNNIKVPSNRKECFIYNNYTQIADRMYFRKKNALKIDAIRLEIEKLGINKNEYYYLISCLLAASNHVVNTTGTFDSFLKYWDNRAYSKIELKSHSVYGKHKSLNLDYKKALEYNTDLVYADPPYNNRSYASCYHLLETIAKYDYPEIKGKTGIRVDTKNYKSDFCSKKSVENAFETLLRLVKSEYLVISYSTHGIMDSNILKEMCLDYAKKFKLIERDYRQYVSKTSSVKPLKELLYILKF